MVADIRLEIFKAQSTRPAADIGIAVEADIVGLRGESAPVQFKFAIERERNARGPAADAIITDFDLRGVPDNAAPVQRCELSRNAANEMPGVAPACEKVGHGRCACWTKC